MDRIFFEIFFERLSLTISTWSFVHKGKGVNNKSIIVYFGPISTWAN